MSDIVINNNESNLPEATGGFSGGAIQEAQSLIDSGFLPSTFKRPEQVITAYMMGAELGFDKVTSINSIHVIEGKPTLSVHAISSLIKKAGVHYELIKDFETVYSETQMLNKEGKPAFNKSGEPVMKKTAIDVETVIEFTQYVPIKTPDGKTAYKEVTNAIGFRWSEAVDQGLDKKPNWKRMKRIMMRARALAIGARFAAPEALMGYYESNEIADSKNITLNIDEEGNPI